MTKPLHSVNIKDQFGQRYGITSGTGTTCIARLFGGRPRDCGLYADHLCLPPIQRAAADIWHRGRDYVALSYHIYPERLGHELEALHGFCDEHELHLQVHSPDESWHVPGRTVLVTISRDPLTPDPSS